MTHILPPQALPPPGRRAARGGVRGPHRRRRGEGDDALRGSARKLEEEDEERSASCAESAAGQLDRFAETLRERDLDGFLGEAELFARRRPAVFLGSAIAAGFVLSRREHGERTAAAGAGGPAWPSYGWT